MVVNISTNSEKLSLLCQLVDLATKLRQERLFVLNEQRHLQDLNTQVTNIWTNLTKSIWTARQQRICVDKLAISHCDYTPASCCFNITTLDRTEFQEARKILSYRAYNHCIELMRYLRFRPQILAQCLLVVNHIHVDVMESIILGLYGCCLLPEDRALMLELLLHLVQLQLAASDDPLRLLRHRACAFARLYPLYNGGLYSATLFLTAALHSPIMSLIMDDEKFLDIDPDGALDRFTASESLLMFGEENDPDYEGKLREHRKWTISKLVTATDRFIKSIRANIQCFPSSICWLVRHIYKVLMDARRVPENQIIALCIELVVTSFICPAIMNPESYGIIEAPLSYIARSNLIQVARIFQILAMRKYEPVDARLADLLSHFKDDCLTSIIHALLEGANMGHDKSDALNKEPCITDPNEQLQQMAHSVNAYFTEQQLHNLIIFLQSSILNDAISKKDMNKLEELLRLVAADFSPVGTTNGNNNNTLSVNNNNAVSNAGGSGGSISPVTMAKRQINLITKAVTKTRTSAGAVASYVLSNNQDDERRLIDIDSSAFVDYANSRDFETVLVFILEDDGVTNMLGLLTEQQVLEQREKCDIIENNVRDTLINVNICAEPSSSSQNKASSTCCSSQDGEEVGSEAGSNQSEDSIDIPEDQNDNLSDMISANVSGRGSPNISGRDTPSSQIMENDNDDGNVMGRPVPPAPHPQAKQPRFDLDDKFGKFEINKNVPRPGDETVSMVSDTWSTDVIGSDCEPNEQSQSVNSSNIGSFLNSSIDTLSPFQLPHLSNNLIDITETASEGWSTDVIVSDSDRVTDTDDAASVARSDITTRSEIESRGDDNEDNSGGPVPLSPNLMSISSHNVHINRNPLASDIPSTSPAMISTSHDPRRNLLSTSFSQTSQSSSTSSHSRSVSSHQASIDSEDIRVSNGEAIANVSMSSAASVSSSSSSAGITDGDIIAKQFSFPEVTSNSNHIGMTSHSVVTQSALTSSSSSTITIGNSCATISLSTNVERDRTSSTRSTVSAKTISFDKTAEKGDKEENRKGFQKVFSGIGIRLPFKNRRDPSWGAQSTSDSLAMHFNNSKSAQEVKIKSNKPLSRSDSGCKSKPSKSNTSKETPYTILEKYGVSSGNSSNDIPSTSRGVQSISQNNITTNNCATVVVDQTKVHGEKFVFEDAKRKLSSVLSNTEIQELPCTSTSLKSLMNMWCQQQNVLVAFLQLQLAEAIYLKDRSLIAHLHETVRCIKEFDDEKCHLLLENLRSDYAARSPYLSYLMRSRQTILSIMAHLNRISKRVDCEQSVCKSYFAALCTRLFLQKRESQLLHFTSEFLAVEVVDEKYEVLKSFLNELEKQIDNDSAWQGMDDQKLEAIKTAIEREVISRVYMYAMFPNGDIDVSRDNVLHEHIIKLSKIITPNHKSFRIPKQYHYECPWPAAQEELMAMSAYKTPAEKLSCILKCIQSMLNLLKLACNKSIPSADICTPVLVYIIIMANPSSLMSTIEYINSFYGSKLQGEERYWWCQFTSAVEFIKTIEYGE